MNSHYEMVLFLLFVVSPPLYVFAMNPGFRTEITQKGFDYVRQVGLPILIKELQSIDIPDQHGSGSGVSYDLTNIKGSGLEIPTSSLTTSASGLTVTGSGASMQINADWHYRMNAWPHISDSGSCDISVSSVSLQLVVLVGATAGHPTVSASSCSFNIGHMEIHFHGGASWLYNLFSDSIANSLRGSISGQVCPQAIKAIETNGNNALATLKLITKLGKDAEIDFQLTQAPVFSTTSLQTFHKGEFLTFPNTTNLPPFQPSPFPPATESSHMMYIWLSDYIANTAGYVYMASGALVYNVTEAPASSPIHLNTDNFIGLIPPLFKKYPDMKMQLLVKANKPPSLTLTSQAATFAAPANVTAFVVTKNMTLINVFTLNVTLYAAVNISVYNNGSDEIINGTVKYLKSDAELLETNIGDFEMSSLNGTLNFACTLVTSQLNKKYAQPGFPIPVVDGVSFVNPEVVLGQDNVLIATDVHYNAALLLAVEPWRSTTDADRFEFDLPSVMAGARFLDATLLCIIHGSMTSGGKAIVYIGFARSNLDTRGLVMKSRAIVFFFVGISCAVNPGFRTELTEAGLDYVRKIGLPILVKELQDLSIPDQTGHTGSPIGTIDYDLTSIKGSGLSIPTSSLTIDPKVGLRVTGSGASMHIMAHWHYRMSSWPHISDSGSCDVSVSSVSLAMVVSVGADLTGHPSVSADQCSFDIGHMSIDFHGGASWLYNLFSGTIASDLKGSIAGQVCPQAIKAIETDGNKALESLPTTVKLTDNSEIDFQLLQAPIFGTSFLQTLHKGEFFAYPHPREAPFQPSPFPDAANSSRMMSIWLSDYIANSAGYVYTALGDLQYHVTEIPSQIPLQLNTSFFKLFIPNLYEKYPNMAMQLFLNVNKPPRLSVSPKEITASAPCNVTAFVVSENKTLVNAFTLNVTMYTAVEVSLHANGSKEIIGGKASYLNSDIELLESNVGSFNVLLLNSTVNFGCSLAVVPFLNEKYLEPGFPIPSVDGVSFVNPDVVLGQDYVFVATDFVYNPAVLFEANDKSLIVVGNEFL
ncbi:uncharacterized protein LOC134176553 [Corticium candelabrum]|uniref:uncharacterized protein LOC134176553 n=1 Tax=Corticium candelabrum TaxID=121492 RepID=UPI002E261BDB|nr:uncharacterized protein LOC134176553 [Corticium candelabrum]